MPDDAWYESRRAWVRPCSDGERSVRHAAAGTCAVASVLTALVASHARFTIVFDRDDLLITADVGNMTHELSYICRSGVAVSEPVESRVEHLVARTERCLSGSLCKLDPGYSFHRFHPVAVPFGSSGSTVLAVRMQGRAEGPIVEASTLAAIGAIHVDGLLQRMALGAALMRPEASYNISGLTLFRELDRPVWHCCCR